MMIAATLSWGVTGLKASTSEARLTSDALMVATRPRTLVARQLKRLPGRQQRGCQSIGLQNGLDVRPGVAGVVGLRDAPHRVARRHGDRVGGCRPTAIGTATGCQRE